MKLIKLNLLAVIIASILGCLLLIWSEGARTCDIFTAQIFETVFIIVALFGLREYLRIK